MNEHTQKLLEECDSGCKMAIDSMDQVEQYVEDPDLIEVIRKYEKQHREIEKEVESMLKDGGCEEKEPGAMASAFSHVSTGMKLTMENDSHQAAKILMDGCNMGIQSISEYRNQYEDADKNAENAAGKLVGMEETMMRDLERFL